MNFTNPGAILKSAVAVGLLCGLVSCSGSSSSSSGNTPAATVAAAKLTSSTVSIAGANTAKGSVSLLNHTLYANAQMATFTEGWGSKEVTIDLGTYDQVSDFGGQNASMTLVGEVQNYPSGLLDSNGLGGAYAVLTSFSVNPSAGGSSIEYVNTTAQCRSEGMWECSSSTCDPHAACTVTAGASGFAGRIDWDQHQVPPYGYITTNTFPRCDSTIGGWTNCPNGFGSLVSGHYYAKFLLLSDSGSSTGNQTATLKVTLSVKKDTQARDATSVNGGINLNVVLVGDQNISDSHTAAGARNLNLLFGEVNRLFSTVSGSKLFINQVKTYEWSNANGGNQYSQVDYDHLGDLFEAGSKGVDAADAGQNINIFIVSDVEYTGASFTILGLSGAILGPPVNGTQSSGLAFSSFNKLASYNPACANLSCGRSSLQADFLEMGATIVHELGHYLGLNHPSEKAASDGSQQNDQLNDTPVCVARGTAPSSILDERACYYVDSTVQAAPIAGSCKSACDSATTAANLPNYLAASLTSASIDPWTSYQNSDMPAAFCPLVSQCQHNHVMWYTTKNRRLQKAGGATCTANDINNGVTCTWNEDGNLFSGESSAILQWDPFVR